MTEREIEETRRLDARGGIPGRKLRLPRYVQKGITLDREELAALVAGHSDCDGLLPT